MGLHAVLRCAAPLLLGMGIGCARPPAHPPSPPAYPSGGYGQPGYPGPVDTPPPEPAQGWGAPAPSPTPVVPPGPAAPAVPTPIAPAEPPHGPIPEGFRQPVPGRALPSNAPAMRYAELRGSACRAMVKQRGLPVHFEAKAVTHVATAVRITGSMHGVRIVTAPAPSPFGILDCRLALALDDMAEVMARFGVTEVRIGSMHRPNARIRGTGKTSQHSHGLAADISAVRRNDGHFVAVKDNWGAKIGDTPCGPSAPMTTGSADALFMRDMVCAIARAQVFHHMLTPSANADHLDHFHFDIQRDARGGWVR